MNVHSMREHVIGLCNDSEIRVTWCGRPAQAYALAECDEICIAPIKSKLSYGTALHEIGHILGRYQRSPKTLVREKWAWVWARSNALEWTPLMESHAQKSLVWYREQIRIGRQPRFST